ncbi:FAD binding domain-containing protein, partial [Paraphoma chrysanthemicola]
MSTPTPSPSPVPAHHPTPTVTTDYLIIGAGPAGSSLSCFLAAHSLTGITLSASPSTSLEPRAHMTNPPALECIRDFSPSLYDDCVRLGNGAPYIQHYRWCETLAGVEYARAKAWGNGKRMGEFEAVSPCGYLDLPQSLLEPVLVRGAGRRGWDIRFGTELLGFREEDEEEGKEGKMILAHVRDNVSRMEYSIRTKYLFGADGGRSTVARILDLPFTSIPGGGFAYNVQFRADLTHIMHHREGNLHLTLRLEKDYPFVGVLRQVKPWTEWMGVFFPKGPHAPNPDRSFEEWREICVDLIGDESVDVEVLHVAGWKVNESSANVLGKGNVFCLGDAVHRHPPMLGLGSNTGIQDAFNLAWKVAMVEKKLAHPSLLSTYTTERQPIAAQLVTESNNILRHDLALWIAMGVLPYGASEDDIKQNIAGLSANTPESRERRKAIFEGTRMMKMELQALGLAMGQRYESSGIYAHDETEPFQPRASEAVNAQENYEPCTYPGRRVPHVWLGKKVPGPLVSTLDVAGRGRFSLFTSTGGGGWTSAAAAVQKALAVEIKVVNVGRGLEWEDIYLDWVEKCEVEEDGCVLVRPDYFVAWRAQEGGNESERLLQVMRSVLGFAGQGDEETKKSNGVVGVSLTNGVKK